MTNLAATIKSRARAAARWYMESWSHMEPAAALGMFGTGIVAIPMTVAGQSDSAC